MDNNIDKIIGFLKTAKFLEFEVVKSNSGQIALNNKSNSNPLVLTNNIGYFSPTPFLWHDIDKEIERLKSIKLVRSKYD